MERLKSMRYLYKCNFWIIAIIILVVPVVLNVLLLLPAPINVIGEPSDWLRFWGAYLGAICSAFAATIAIYQNLAIRKQNSIKAQIAKETDEYNRLESYILENNQLLSVNSFCRMALLLKSDDANNRDWVTAFSQCQSIHSDTERSTTLFERYKEDELLKAYGMILIPLANAVMALSETMQGVLLRMVGADCKPDPDFHSYCVKHNVSESNLDSFVMCANDVLSDSSSKLYHEGEMVLEAKSKTINCLYEALATS